MKNHPFMQLMTRPRSKRKRESQQRVNFEKLEPRQLLAADGVVVANYRSDFGASNDWAYEYNLTPELTGDDAVLDSLGGDSFVFSTGSEANEYKHLKLTEIGGHPGVGGTNSRFSIATYTIAESSDYELTDSFVKLQNNARGASDGVEFKVFVNDDPILISGLNQTGERHNFDVKLGFLSKGDKVRVAFGAHQDRRYDFFEMDFSIRKYSDRVSVVADFQQSLRDENPAWQFLWNAPSGWQAGTATGDLTSGRVGDPASYRPLIAASNGVWTPDGDSINNSSPDYNLRFDAMGGHPGNGYQVEKGLQNRYSIAAYTVERSGIYAFADSSLTASADSNDGLELIVHVNDGSSFYSSSIVTPGTTFNFGQAFGELGNLKKGDTVYLAVGANNNHRGDRFTTDVKLARVLPRVEPLREIEVSAGNTFYAADFGAVINDRQNDFVAITEVLNTAAQADGPAKVVFEKGIYNVAAPNGFSDRFFFKVLNDSNLEIDGKGATIIVDDFKRGLIQVLRSENVIIRNLNVDYAEISRLSVDPVDDSYRATTFVQGIVSEIDTNANSFILTIDPEQSIAPDSTFVAGSEPGVIAWGYLVDSDVDGRLKQDSSWNYATESVQPISSRQFRIQVDRTIGFAEGDRYVIQRRVNVSAFGVFVDSNQISFIDVDIFASPSSFVTVTHSDAVNLIRSNALIKVSSGRWKGINADAVHGQSMRVGFWVEDSRFNGVGDDVMNFYAVPAAAISQSSPNSLVMAFVNFSSLQGIHSSAYQVGDVLKFVDPLDSQLIIQARVTNIQPVEVTSSEHGSFRTQEVTFDQPINGVKLASKQGEPNSEGYRNDTAIYNAEYSDGFLVQGTRMTNSRRYGQFVMANNVQLVDSVYGGLSDSAIAGHNQSSWPIGLFSNDVLVQNNRFLLNGFSNRYFREDYFAGVVAFHMDRFRDQLVDRADYAYSNLTIVDNEFRGWGKVAIAVRNASNVEIGRNRIFIGARNPAEREVPTALDVRYTSSTSIFDNELYSNDKFLNSIENIDLSELSRV